MSFKLKKDLLLGVATASTQIEGGDKNNSWYNWTKNHDKTVDKTDCLLANSHYENYKEHIDLMSELHLEIYRMSIEWSRIEPKEDEFSMEGINHYIDEIKYLQSKGIKVLVTLHHFSNPIWFDDKGGFKKKKYAIDRFSKYVTFVVTHLKDLVNEYCTINEPNVYTVNTFLFGEWLQQEKSFFTAMKVLRNLSYCHIKAYKIIHELVDNAKVSFALNVTRFEAYRKNNIFDKFGTWFYNRGFNIAITEAMCYGKLVFPLGFRCKKGEYFDYLGINYYTTRHVKGFKQFTIKEGDHNDLGWLISPNGFLDVLTKYHDRYKKDIYITENGTCDKVDAFRCQFLYEHLKVVSTLDFVKRYYYWTFMDNYEWQEGQLPCFGLVEYFYDTKTYKPRNSAYLYKEIIDNREINLDMMNRYNIKEREYDK